MLIFDIPLNVFSFHEHHKSISIIIITHWTAQMWLVASAILRKPSNLAHIARCAIIIVIILFI